MAMTFLPPGFRFYPTDVELALYYLKRKILGKPLELEIISEIDLYKFSPWDLPDKSCLQSKDLEWYFFCRQEKRYACGSRTNRLTDTGFWKISGKGKFIRYDSRTIAFKSSLVFYIGRVHRGERTDWVMYEFRLEDKELVNAGFSHEQNTHVLCKIFQKSGRGPKLGEQYGAPYKNEDWEDDMVNEKDISIQYLPCLPNSLDYMSSPSGSIPQQSVGLELGESPHVQHLIDNDAFLDPVIADPDISLLLLENADGESSSIVLHGNNSELADDGTQAAGKENPFDQAEQELVDYEQLLKSIGELEPIDMLYYSDNVDKKCAWTPLLSEYITGQAPDLQPLNDSNPFAKGSNFQIDIPRSICTANGALNTYPFDDQMHFIQEFTTAGDTCLDTNQMHLGAPKMLLFNSEGMAECFPWLLHVRGAAGSANYIATDVSGGQGLLPNSYF